MSADLLTALCHLGHVATAEQLRSLGSTKRTLASALADGWVRRAARGVYVCNHIDGALMSAAQAGGQVDCLTSLQRHKVWSGIPQPALHLRMRPHQHSKRLPPAAVVHWSAAYNRSSSPLEVAHIDALLQAIGCLPPNDALASVESALYKGFIDEDDFAQLIRLAPERLQGTFAKLDRGAQSGYETHTRLLLVDAGFRVQTQFSVPGAGHIDLLVNGCVGVETDGEEWHGPERFLPDRTKDIIAEGVGIRTLRIGGPHIFVTWPRTLAAIRRMVDDAESGR